MQLAIARDYRTPPNHVAAVQHIAAGQTLFWESDPARCVYEIKSGAIRGTCFSAEGERQIIGFFHAGDEIGLPVSDAYLYSAEAISDVSYVAYPQTVWTGMLQDKWSRGDGLLRAVRSEQLAIYQRGLLIGIRSAVARLSAFLAGLHDRLNPYGNGFHMTMSQGDIADYLALAPETVCRALKTLKERHIIDMPTHHRIDILDEAALRSAY